MTVSDPSEPRNDRELIVLMSAKMDDMGNDIKEIKGKVDDMATKTYVDANVGKLSDRLDDHIAEHPPVESSGFWRFVESKVGGIITIVLCFVLLVGADAIVSNGDKSDTQQIERDLSSLVKENDGKGN